MPKDLSKQPTPAQPPTTPEGYLEQRPVGHEAQGAKLPEISERRWPFWLEHHWSSWELVKVDGTWMYLPVIGHLPLVPGCNMVEQPKNPGERVKTERTFARWGKGEMGHVVLNDTRLYLTEVDAAHGPAYFTRWEHVLAYEDGTWEMEFDQAGWDQFRIELVVAGVIDPPRPGVMRQLAARLRKRLGRQVKHIKVPGMDDTVKDTRERLEAAEVAIVPGEDKPKRKSKASTKPKRAPAKPASDLPIEPPEDS